MFDVDHIDLPPLRGATGTVVLPGSKSISNRALLLAGLSDGITELVGLLDSDDTRVMIDALRALGCAIEVRTEGTLSVTAVTGLGGRARTDRADLFLGNAGTAMRPLAATTAVLATLHGGDYRLSGVTRMHERPIGDLVDALRAMGCAVDDLGQPGYPPLRVHGQPGGQLDLDAPIRVRGDVSSQFLTALLLALPLAATERAVTIAVDGELISKPYIAITLALLERFGIAVECDGFARFTIPAGSRYRSPGRLRVEADASSASYFVALGAIAGTGAPIVIDGLGLSSIQGDIRFVEAAQQMGADITGGPDRLTVRRGAWPLKAITLDCNHIPDAAMTLAVMALYADGPTRLDNIASWRVKETDRLAAMAAELRKVGADVEEGDDHLVIHPPRRWRPADIETYDDHRMAMCLSLAAFNPMAAGATPAAGVALRIRDPRCVAKTFPDYFEALFALVPPGAAAVPVITIDGPTASGKGTLAGTVAQRLGWHQLDSGLLYRATALAAMHRGVADDDEAGLAAVAAGLQLRFEGDKVWLRGNDVATDLRQEAVGSMASRISALPAVRQALHALQLAYARLPGLVADGRDMGTVIFPQAPLKVFLTASPAMRAERRYKQLISKGISASLPDLHADLEARDARDRSRSVAPLVPAEDALLLDNSGQTIEQSVDQVLDWWAARAPFQPPSAQG